MEFSCLALNFFSEIHRQKNTGFQTVLASTQQNHTAKPQLYLLLLAQREASSEIVKVLDVSGVTSKSRPKTTVRNVLHLYGFV